jgi:hypothetical protein
MNAMYPAGLAQAFATELSFSWSERQGRSSGFEVATNSERHLPVWIARGRDCPTTRFRRRGRRLLALPRLPPASDLERWKDAKCSLAKVSSLACEA